MGWECFCVVGFDLGPLLQGGTRILHLQYFFKYVLTYFLHLNSYLVTFLHNTICRAQLFCPFLLSASEFLSNMLFNYHLLYFCTALTLVIMLSSHYHLHKSKTLSQLTQCPFTGTLLLFFNSSLVCSSKDLFKQCFFKTRQSTSDYLLMIVLHKSPSLLTEHSTFNTETRSLLLLGHPDSWRENLNNNEQATARLFTYLTNV